MMMMMMIVVCRAARHGLQMNGKLSRLAQQEADQLHTQPVGSAAASLQQHRQPKHSHKKTIKKRKKKTKKKLKRIGVEDS